MKTLFLVTFYLSVSGVLIYCLYALKQCLDSIQLMLDTQCTQSTTLELLKRKVERLEVDSNDKRFVTDKPKANFWDASYKKMEETPIIDYEPTPKRQKAEEFLIIFAATDLKVREKIFSEVTPAQFKYPSTFKVAQELIKSKDVNTLLFESIKDGELRTYLTNLILTAKALNLASPHPDECEVYMKLLNSDDELNRIAEIKSRLKELDDCHNEDKDKDKDEVRSLLQEVNTIAIGLQCVT